MKQKDISSICLKLCISSLLLFGISDSVFSKENNKERKTPNNNLYQAVADSVKEIKSNNSPIVTASCVNIFKDQTVSSAMTVLGCDSLVVQNVTITNGGDLTLSAPENIILNGPFVGELGSILNIKAGDLQYVFDFFTMLPVIEQ